MIPAAAPAAARPSDMELREQRARERAERAGQGHLFAHWGALDAAARGRLLAEVEELDFDLVARLVEVLRAGGEVEPPQRIEPPRVFPLHRDARTRAEAREAVEAGEELLAAGRVGFLLVAGGQASRLGFDGPKGCFPVGPVSGRTLFELHARRLLAARRRYGVPAPWYVMTSRANDAPTRAFFEEHGFFGLERGDVRFFSQAMLPALDFEGRILMRAPDALFLAPNGHGGVLEALGRSGSLDDARARGLEQLSYFQVDNPLVRPADALFLGLHVRAGAGMSSKVVAKRDPHEKVGVLGRVDGRMSCIEYSDLPEQLRHARDEAGDLLFRAGNIAVHVLERRFVEQLVSGSLRLPWHVARKAMEVHEDGATVEREGAKFETFVFDALQHSPSSVVLEVERRAEFSPVKNKEGEDSPASARADLCRLHADWVAAAGLKLPPVGDDGVHPVEVDPLLAEDAETLRARAPRAPRVVDGGHLYE